MKVWQITVGMGLVGLLACGCSSTPTAAPANEAAAAPAAERPLGIPEVQQMVQARVSDPVIIAQIQNSRSIFHLSASDVIGLKQSGVSDAVIGAMQATAALPPAPPAVVSAPAAVVVEPAPPPVYVGFGYGYYRHRW